MGKASRRKRERRYGACEPPEFSNHGAGDLTVGRTPVIYRYLEEEAHVLCWTDGGQIPVRQALYYRTLEGSTGRADVEDSMHRRVQGMSLSQIQNPNAGPSPVRIAPGANIGLMEFTNCTFAGPQGVSYIAHGTLSQNHPSALVLCLSTELSRATAEAIDHKCKYCVEVDLSRLKRAIDIHVGAVGVAKQVQYTDGDNRNTFLKDSRFRGQAEYRLAWEGVDQKNVWVDLPAGVARRVDIPL